MEPANIVDLRWERMGVLGARGFRGLPAALPLMGLGVRELACHGGSLVSLLCVLPELPSGRVMRRTTEGSQTLRAIAKRAAQTHRGRN